MKGPYYSDRKTYELKDGQNLVKLWETNNWYRTSNGVQQRQPLPWERFKSSVSKWAGAGTGNSAVQATQASVAYYALQTWGRRENGSTNDLLLPTANKAYGKLLDKIRSNAGVGQNIAEYKQTLELLKGALGAIKSPLKTFAKAVQVHFRKNRDATIRTPLKSMSDAWLIWHFGVEPLIKDLHAVMERLESASNFQWERHTASAQGRWGFAQNAKKLPDGWYTDESYRSTIRLSLEVRYKSPQLALMNDFGLVNPAAIAWELVPFSFVVDWFYPVGSYLNSFTDLLGYETRNPSTTYVLRFVGQQCYIPTNGVFSPATISGVRISRRLQSPTFKLPPFEIPAGLSPTRGFTAIALILQTLKNR